ncbi:hypothetical protein [Streptomyces gardneri]|uniref:hypothetical protein n=1 Tax=Streptomyces gardneri TaxID=66892 RepID=UPI0006E3BCB2|nr:hypothetical protein [Streptomyces gardneri]WRK34496.1 hypothetical protein U0M97_00455 [Streptomyces venezuelae]
MFHPFSYKFVDPGAAFHQVMQEGDILGIVDQLRVPMGRDGANRLILARVFFEDVSAYIIG